jgi:hypothetical protein
LSTFTALILTFGAMPAVPWLLLEHRNVGELPTWAAWAGRLATGALCLWRIDRRLRASEVVS